MSASSARRVPAQFTSGIVFAISGTFLFASKSILAKWVYVLGGDAIHLLTLRMLYSMPAYAIIGGLTIRKVKAPPSLWIAKAAGLGFFGYYLAAYLDLAGLELISAQLERLTLFTYPALTTLLAWWFLGEAFTWRTAASIALCFAGIAVMSGSEVGLAASTQEITLGVGLVMGAAVSYSLYVILAKPMMQRFGSTLFTSLAMTGSGVFVAIHFSVQRTWSELADLDPRIHLHALTLAMGCTVLPSYLINSAIVRIGASRTSIIGTAGPVLTMLLAIVVLQEPSTTWHFLGMSLAIAGVTLISGRNRN